MFAARYEDLKIAPRAVLTALFAYCGVSLSSDAALQQPIDRYRVAELRNLIHQYAPTLQPDSLVPQTLCLALRVSANARQWPMAALP